MIKLKNKLIELLNRIPPKVGEFYSSMKLRWRFKSKRKEENIIKKLLIKGEEKIVSSIVLLKKMIKLNKNGILNKLKLPKFNLVFKTMKALSLFVFIAVIILGQLISPQVASAATFNFSQNGWAGGPTSNMASHLSNQTGWTEFSSKNGVDTSSTVTLTPSVLSTTKTNSIDFATGINSQTTISGFGDNSSIKINKTNFAKSMVVQSGDGLSNYILKSDGTVWSWGGNGNGQLGDNTTTQRNTPVQVHGTNDSGYLTNIISISAGYNSAYALKSDGTVWAWGNNDYGQLGDNTTTVRNTPVQVKGSGAIGSLTSVISIANSYSSAYALKSDGTVWAWGRNDYGQLGDNTNTSRNTPVQVKGSGAIGSLNNIVYISANNISAYALKSDGTVWSWGSNSNGQLGDNTTTQRFTPVQVHGFNDSGFLSDIISINTNNISSYAVKSDGTVWSWGGNGNGQLGDNTTTQRNTPVQVHGTNDSGYLTNIISISAGYNSAYALKSDGTVWAWGNNDYGQLGDNTTTVSNTPIQIHGVSNSGFLTGSSSVFGGYNSAYAIKSDGTVLSWGINSGGQLGDNTTIERHTPVSVLWKELGNFNIGIGGVVKIVNSGSSYSSYALKSDGTVWAWGSNDYGQLGDNTIESKDIPVQVHGANNSGFLTGVTSISVGSISAYALKSDGTVWAWGRNDYGQLGDNTTTERHTPVQVHGVNDSGFLTGVASIYSGQYSSYAVKSDGTVWSWGGNGNGQLGDNTTTQRNTPVQVHGANDSGFLTGVSSISGSGNYGHGSAAYALKLDGTVWAWGDNYSGQLGDNTTTQRFTPVQVHGANDSGFLTGVSSISAGSISAYALKLDGTVWAWGYNAYGQLGDNTTTQRNTPVQVHGANDSGFLTNITSISASSISFYALKSDGTVWSWGNNNYGQLGDNTISERHIPAIVRGPGNTSSLTNIVSISAGYSSAYALKSDGTVWSWGSNSDYQLGDSTQTQRNTPVNVKDFLLPVILNAGVDLYYSSGFYTSSVFNLNGISDLKTITYNLTLNGQTATVDFRAGDIINPDGTWTGWLTNISSGGSISSLGSHRYIQYRVNLATSISSTSPTFDLIKINYNQYTTGDLTSSIYDSVNSINSISKLSWTESGTTGTETIKFQVRSSADGNTWSLWCGYSDCSGSTYFNSSDNNVSLNTVHPLRNGVSNRYVQYKVFLASAGKFTPTLSSVHLNYVVNVAPVFNVDYPVVSGGGVSAIQNSDSQSPNFGKVNISYSAKDIDTTLGTVNPNKILPSFEYSIDGGTSWSPVPTNDLASGNTSLQTILDNSFTVYNAIWSAKNTIPESSIASARIRVTINDNEAAKNTAVATTSSFTIDTKAPVGSITFDAGVAGETNSGTVFIPMPTDQSPIQYLISDNPTTQTNPVNTGWVTITSNTTIPWTFDSDVEVKSLKYQFKDAYGNITTESTVGTQTPVISSSFIVQDTSNVSSVPPYFSMYLGWQAASATGFSSYKLEYATSVNNSIYGSYTTISDASFQLVNSNYYVYNNLNSNLFYRFRLGVVGTNGNTSVRSNSFITVKPDGVQNYSEGGGGSISTASKVENVVVTQNEDKTVIVGYKVTDVSFSKKINPSYEAYLFYNIGMTLPSNALVGDTITLLDASKLKSSGYILINNEVISYSGKTGNTLTGIIRGTWPTLNSTGRTSRMNANLFSGTIVWVYANSTTPVSITNNTIATGQNNSISWNTYSETGLAGGSYTNTGIKVIVHDNQDASFGPLSSQNDYSENGMLSVLDLTAPVVSFNQATSSATESTTPVNIPLYLARAYPFTTTVSYTVTGTATSGSDFTLANGIATILAGETTTNISFPIINDIFKERDETVILTLSDPINGKIGGNSSHTYTIIDDDNTSTVEFDSVSSSGLESVVSVNIPISLSEISLVDTTVNYSISGTATNGSDFILSDGIATILAGASTTSIVIPITNDTLKEDDETIIITLSDVTNNILGLNSVHTYTILNDDLFPVLSFNSGTSEGLESVNSINIPVSIPAAYLEDVTFSYSVTGGTATGGGVDYTLENGTLTIPAGEISANINLGIIDDGVSEPTETIIINLSNLINSTLGVNSVYTYSILDDEISGNGIKSTSALISWMTSDLSDSLVEYGTVSPGNEGAYNLSKFNADKVLKHNIYLGNLIPSTTYYIKTTSTDLNGETVVSTSGFTTTPGPIIGGVNSGDITDRAVTITWVTNIPASSYVNYSTNASLSTPFRFGSDDLTTEHSVSIANLSAQSLYYYSVDGIDVDSNAGEDANDGNYYTFTTSEDQAAPIISDISVPIITSTQVAVVWRTNELSDGKIMYGTSAGNYDHETSLVSIPETNHLITIGGLTGTTIYYYVIVSADRNGNTATTEEQTLETTAIERVIVSSGGGGGSSGVPQSLYDALLAENENFKAKLKDFDFTMPIISNIKIDEITAFSATVSFDTDEDAISFIDYGKDNKYGLMAADKSWSKSHTIKLYGLSLGTDYYLKINAMNRANDVSTSDEQTFKTKFLADDLEQLKNIDNVEQFQAAIEAAIESILPSLVPPFIDKPAISNITESGATVTFRTNIKSYPIVNYTTDADYDKTKENPYDGEISDTSEKNISHTLSLVGLKPNTKYHVMVKAFSIPQVIGKSEDFTFTTSASKIQGSIVGIKKNSFTVVWSTDEITSSIVEYKNLKTGRSSRIVDEAKNKSHSIKVENLSPGTSYEVSISGINEKGNKVESGSAINVKTSTDNIAPIITNIKVDSALVVARNDRVQTIVSWQTDEPSTSTVYFGEGTGSLNEKLSNKQEDLELTKSHVVILTALKPGTIYRFTVSSADDANNITKPPVRTIITPRKTESIVDVIFKNFDETFKFMNNVK